MSYVFFVIVYVCLFFAQNAVYFMVRWNMRSAECGVRSVENAECGKCGV